MPQRPLLLLQNSLSVWQELQTQLLQTLSPTQQKDWEHWSRRISGEKAHLAMLSTRYRRGKIPITRKEAKINDKNWDQFVNSYMLWEVEDHARECRYNPQTRQKLIKIGCGTGLGVGYFEEAIRFLDLEAYDWLQVALEYCEKALASFIREHGINENKLLRIGEASQVCQNLDPSSTAIVEMFRVEEHMSEEDAALALQGAGRILNYPGSRVILGGARKGERNDNSPVETCHHRDTQFLLDSIQSGTDREVIIYREKVYRGDIDKDITLHTFRAKP